MLRGIMFLLNQTTEADQRCYGAMELTKEGSRLPDDRAHPPKLNDDSL